MYLVWLLHSLIRMLQQFNLQQDPFAVFIFYKCKQTASNLRVPSIDVDGSGQQFTEEALKSTVLMGKPFANRQIKKTL